jgi:bacillolysin
VFVGRTLLAGFAVSIGVVVVLSHGSVSAQGRSSRTIAATDGTAIRTWDTAVDRMARDGSLKVKRTDEDTLIPNRVHERLDQYHQGVRVYGADITRQTDRGVTVSVFGNLYSDINISVDPDLTASDAAAIVKRESGVDLGPEKMPQLLILPSDNQYRLVYHASAYTMSGGTEYFIDAHDGSVVLTLDAARHQNSAVGVGTGVLGDSKKLSVSAVTGGFQANDLLRPPTLRTYDMKGDLNRTIDILNGVQSLLASDRATDSDNTWTDRADVDAHAHAGYVYDYYYKRFNRHGLDNNNFQILSIVHPASRQASVAQINAALDFYVNAFYLGGFSGVMVYGEGLPDNLIFGGQHWDYLAGALDVVGHELTHGVTEFTSNLIYQNESGALNESFSDMMGTSIEFFYQPAGTGPLKADYLIGEDVITPGGLRSMANPVAFGQPDHYSRRFIASPPTAQNDYGGVHINSGIGNQAFYLAIEGGTNRTSGLAVQGVGAANRDQIEKTMYRAFTLLIPSNATYSVARTATIQAATDLYGASSAAVRAITQAWTAVGVN